MSDPTLSTTCPDCGGPLTSVPRSVPEPEFDELVLDAGLHPDDANRVRLMSQQWNEFGFYASCSACDVLFCDGVVVEVTP